MIQAEGPVCLRTDGVHFRALRRRVQEAGAEGAQAAGGGHRGDQGVAGRATAHAAQDDRVIDAQELGYCRAQRHACWLLT